MESGLSRAGWLHEHNLLSSKHLCFCWTSRLCSVCSLLQRRKFLPRPSSCCFSLLPLHTHPCQEICTISPHTTKKKKKMQVDSPYCSVLCVTVGCVRIYLWFHFELLLPETGTVLCFFVSFWSNIFKDTDDPCLLSWKKKRTSLPFLKRLAFLSYLWKLCTSPWEQEWTSVRPVSEWWQRLLQMDTYTCTYFITHFLEFPTNQCLSFHCTRKNCHISRDLYIYVYRERINVPELSILALFTGTDCGAPGDRAFTQRASDAIFPPPTGIHRGRLRVSHVWLSGRGSVHGGRVCRHSKGTDVFERLRACGLAGAGSLVCRHCTLA